MDSNPNQLKQTDSLGELPGSQVSGFMGENTVTKVVNYEMEDETERLKQEFETCILKEEPLSPAVVNYYLQLKVMNNPEGPGPLLGKAVNALDENRKAMEIIEEEGATLTTAEKWQVLLSAKDLESRNGLVKSVTEYFDNQIPSLSEGQFDKLVKSLEATKALIIFKAAKANGA